jgi:hypothetical protein
MLRDWRISNEQQCYSICFDTITGFESTVYRTRGTMLTITPPISKCSMVSSNFRDYTVAVFFTVALHASDTRTALLGSWLNNTKVYSSLCDPIISTEINPIAE